jgi:hypothetical protein
VVSQQEPLPLRRRRMTALPLHGSNGFWSDE